MNYTLNKPFETTQKNQQRFFAFKTLWPMLREEKLILFGAFFAIICNSLLTLVSPLIIARTIDTSIAQKEYHGLFVSGGWLLAVYACSFVIVYLQTTWMGGVGQRLLFRLRNRVFTKLQELPVAFFSQNKTGDLISRINNDTDKLNQFFSQSLMQFIGSIFVMIGASLFLLALHVRLGATALSPAIVLFVLTQLLSTWVKNRNATSMKSTGALSSEIQESLENFKVVVAFNRRDYFRERFQTINQQNYQAAKKAGFANNLFTPLYSAAANIAQLLVLIYGLSLIATGQFSLGLLVSFLAYLNNFYHPLRHLAALWTSYQVAMAGWDRISEILRMESDLVVLPKSNTTNPDQTILSFQHVSFSYSNEKRVLHDVSFVLEKGKTYALVGPTGGGKTTTASLMARLFDPTEGTILLDGADLRTYTPAERVKRIGFILQEPFLFAGSLRDNLVYGNEEFGHHDEQALDKVLQEMNLSHLLIRFPDGLRTQITGSDSISLGQKQLIAFMRAVLRRPALLILDEATANIDTVTEQLLEDTLTKLPPETTRVIIAHRLNTIESADEIFFVNGGTITKAGSMQAAVDMLLHQTRKS